MAITRKQAEETYQKKFKEYIEVIEIEIDNLLVEHLSRMKEACVKEVSNGSVIATESCILKHLTGNSFDWKESDRGKVFLKCFSREDIFNILKEKYKDWKFKVTEFELDERGYVPESQFTFYLPGIPKEEIEEIENGSKINKFELLDIGEQL